MCPHEECEKSFREKGNLLTHMKTHAPQDFPESTDHTTTQQRKKHPCDLSDTCLVGYSTLDELQHHQQTEHIQASFHNYVCDVCQTKFLRARNLQTHLLWHKQASRIDSRHTLCFLCDRSFPDQHQLQKHLAAHDSEHEHLAVLFRQEERQRPRDAKFESKEMHKYEEAI